MTVKQINKFCDWVMVRFKPMYVTHKHNIGVILKNEGLGCVCWQLKRWRDYHKEMKKRKLTEFEYKERWNKFMENREHFMSTQALESKLNYIQSLNNKQSIEDILENNRRTK